MIKFEPQDRGPSKLLADAMLGRLAKWLRLLGYDTAYVADTDDYAVMRLARAEDRLILTRDQGLAGKQGVQALLIQSDQLEEQLRQVADVLGPPGDPSGSRCPECNVALEAASADAVRARVPAYVRKTQEQFSICPGCGRVYWPGTHWERMQRTIGKLQDGGGSGKM